MLNFSESHDNYHTAYRYICKSDIGVFLSANHPILKDIGSPKTRECIKAYRIKCKNKVTEDQVSTQKNQSVKTTKESKPRRLYTTQPFSDIFSHVTILKHTYYIIFTLVFFLFYLLHYTLSMFICFVYFKFARKVVVFYRSLPDDHYIY